MDVGFSPAAKVGRWARRRQASAQAPRSVRVVRGLPSLTKLMLFVRAGGRCEFDGCNEFLLRHSVTKLSGNFAQIAHIVAFNVRGPRGRSRLADRHDLKNLMLLGSDCHVEIDRNPERYNVGALREFKRKHEERIRRLTGAHPDRDTTIVIVQARIGQQAVDISPSDIHHAIEPRYPAEEEALIDLTQFPDNPDGLRAATHELDRRLQGLYAPRTTSTPIRHVSVFALAPIPLLTFLGSKLSSKIPADLYQRHRDTERWTWKTTGTPVVYTDRIGRRGTIVENVAVLVALTGTIDPSALPVTIDHTFTIYELTTANPQPDFLRQRQDLTSFQQAYRSLLRTIMRNHPAVHEIHLFPAVPAPVAISIGRDLLPKIDPTVIVYEHRRPHGYLTSIRINTP